MALRRSLRDWGGLCRVATRFGGERWQSERQATWVLPESSSLAGQRICDPGQPSPQTHPQLLGKREIMPGISADEFAQRRKKLMALLPKASVVIIASALVKQMTDAVPYSFRQDADYLYFTGCQQPGGVAVLYDDAKLCLFMPSQDPEKAIWDGHIADAEDAKDFFGADIAYSTERLSEVLSKMMGRAKFVFADTDSPPERVCKLSAFGQAMLENKVQNLNHFSHRLRWIKSPSEINLMRNAASIACQAFLRTMKASTNLEYEYQLAAQVEYECKIRGAQRMSFPSVVGAGANSSIIHYSRNDKQLEEGELVLMDAGCEYFGYVSDMTRTWPPGSTFLPAQREVYEVVLAAVKECINLCQPGTNLAELHAHSMSILKQGIVKHGLVDGSSKLKHPMDRRWNPTIVGHYLGMDVHDCKQVRKEEILKPGVVITIEPGLYFSANDLQVRKPFRGIGVRIEDEILITESGHEVLTASVPKDVEELESWLQSQHRNSLV